MDRSDQWLRVRLKLKSHQPFSSNGLDLSTPEEAYSRNIRASGTLQFGYEGVFKIRGLQSLK